MKRAWGGGHRCCSVPRSRAELPIMTETTVHRSFQSSVAPAGASMCQVQEGGNVLRAGPSAGPSAHPLICDSRTQQAGFTLAAHTCSGSHNQLSPSAVVSLCPFRASNANPSLLLLEAPPACHPLPSPLELALGSDLWQIFANGHPRLTKNAAWGSARKLHTGVHSDSPEDSPTHRSLWPLVSAWALDTSHDGPWKLAPPPPGQLLPPPSLNTCWFSVGETWVLQ